MADCVAGCVEEVEGAVFEPVVGFHSANADDVGAGEVDFDEFAASEIWVVISGLCWSWDGKGSNLLVISL